jgi:hypothetical protein
VYTGDSATCVAKEQLCGNVVSGARREYIIIEENVCTVHAGAV